MSTFKYTKKTDYFIATVLPYLELLFREYPSTHITLFVNYNLGCITMAMFGDRITTCKLENNKYVMELDEIDNYLSRYYDLTERLKMLPLNLDVKHMEHLKSKKLICIFPKFRKNDAYHNMTEEMLKKIQQLIPKDYEYYIIGEPSERLNTRLGKDITNFMDALCALKHCKLFIASESDWHYFALLCNCRNILVFSTLPSNCLTYNPYICNKMITCDLTDVRVAEFIAKTCMS